MCKAQQLTGVRPSNKEDEMKKSQSMHGKIARTSEFNTLIGKPKGRDHSVGLTINSRMLVNLILIVWVKGIN
jgi:hypothetical protein